MRSSSLFQSIPALLVQLDDGALCMLVTKLSNLEVSKHFRPPSITCDKMSHD